MSNETKIDPNSTEQLVPIGLPPEPLIRSAGSITTSHALDTNDAITPGSVIESAGSRDDELIEKNDSLAPELSELIRKPKEREVYLFAPVETTISPPISSSLGTTGNPKPREVTEKTKTDAIDTIQNIIYKDRVLGLLLAKFCFSHGFDIDALPESLRSDSTLRLNVGMYLKDKLERKISSMPPRVIEDSQKTPQEGGYDKLHDLTSREYVILLALSILDGTFSHERTRHDEITYSENSPHEAGQHRFAAFQLLQAQPKL